MIKLLEGVTEKQIEDLVAQLGGTVNAQVIFGRKEGTLLFQSVPWTAREDGLYDARILLGSTGGAKVFDARYPRKDWEPVFVRVLGFVPGSPVSGEVKPDVVVGG